MDIPNGGQNGGQTNSQTKRRELFRASSCIAMAALCRRRLPGWHSAEEVVAAVAPTMATSQPSVVSHCQLGPAGYGPTTAGRPVPRVCGFDRGSACGRAGVRSVLGRETGHNMNCCLSRRRYLTKSPDRGRGFLLGVGTRAGVDSRPHYSVGLRFPRSADLGVRRLRHDVGERPIGFDGFRPQSVNGAVDRR